MKVPKIVEEDKVISFDEHKTVDVHASPVKEGVQYTLIKPNDVTNEESDLVIKQVCQLAVDSAKPGTKFTLPIPINPVVNKALDDALKEKYKNEYKPGQLQVPWSLRDEDKMKSQPKKKGE
jgi:hypothetical protein